LVARIGEFRHLDSGRWCNYYLRYLFCNMTMKNTVPAEIHSGVHPARLTRLIYCISFWLNLALNQTKRTLALQETG
jgi:hypothetical protein